MGGMKMRKTICLILALCCWICTILPTSADTEAKAYCVAASGSCEILTGENTDEAYGTAGLCKLPAILTLCSSFDRGLIHADSVVTVGKGASRIGGPTAFLKEGEQIRAEELIRAAVMISAGDAIWALMEHAFGSEDVFLQNIQLTLKEIGIDRDWNHAIGTNERFTCRELVMLGDAALRSETFTKYCTTKYEVLHHDDGRETQLSNANKLIGTLSGCIGLITGSSPDDGYCGIFACKRKETTFLCVVIGSKNSKLRFETATRLLESAFQEYTVYEISNRNEPLIEDYPVDGGAEDTIDLYTRENISLLRKKSEGEPAQQFYLPDVLSAPLDPERSVGSVLFTDLNGSKLYELAIYPEKPVEATGYREILKRVILSYCTG